MRFLMIGISIVIGIILVGVVFSVTTDLTQPKEVSKIVEFEILSLSSDINGKVTSGTYDSFKKYVTNENELITITDIYVNNERIGGTEIYDNAYYKWYDSIVSNDMIVIYELTYVDSVFIGIFENNQYQVYDYEFQLGDKIKIVFLVEETQITSTSAILIALVPLLFATGVILYTYNTTLKERKE